MAEELIALVINHVTEKLLDLKLVLIILDTGMKTPLSPSQLLERGQIFAFGGMCQELMDPPIPTTISLSMQQTPSTGQSGTYSLCDVCNLQLTSAAQAQLHYNGRSHLRRVRQLQAGETGQQTAAGAQSRSLPQATGLSSQPAGLTPTPGLCPGLSVPTSSTSVLCVGRAESGYCRDSKDVF
nr:zinc finger protein 385C-like [Labrus bergylta]